MKSITGSTGFRAFSGRHNRMPTWSLANKVARLTTASSQRRFIVSNAPMFKTQCPKVKWWTRPAGLRRSCRTFATSTFSFILGPPAVFLGLVVTLWVYKCCMMVLFQDKIIYMPSVPPFSRREKVADYARACEPIVWRREMIKSTDGTSIALCIGSNVTNTKKPMSVDNGGKHLVILYLQGNASSTPPRLPQLSNVLKSNELRVPCTIIALSYRGFWESSGRASQAGIEKDAEAAIAFAQSFCAGSDGDTALVLWGQSIGAGVATIATAAAHLKHVSGPGQSERHRIEAMILETPFKSIRHVLVALYPQRWLPYRYLGSFLWNKWDSVHALQSLEGAKHMRTLILTAEKDEIVPPEHGPELFELCRKSGLDTVQHTIRGALHTEVLSRQEGRNAIAKFLRQLSRSAF